MATEDYENAVAATSFGYHSRFFAKGEVKYLIVVKPELTIYPCQGGHVKKCVFLFRRLI